MRASMRADGTTFHPRHTSDPVGTEDPDVRERLGGVPHKDEGGVETTADSATRELLELSLPPEWIGASE